MQQEDFKWFVENNEKLYEQYPNQYLVIKDKKVVFTCRSSHQALEKALNEGLEYGTFIVQLCSQGDSAYTVSYHSRVIFV